MIKGTSGTTSGYSSIDRFAVDHSGTDEAPTQSQVDVLQVEQPIYRGI